MARRIRRREGHEGPMSRHHIVTPPELSSLRDLELLSRRAVEGLRQGLHRSPFHGYSAEFSQYRHYRPGDDLKYVDWKAFGRTDRLYSRQFRETTNLGAMFVLDVSRSMAFPAQGESKFARARAVAAVLAALVIDQGDAAGLLAVSGAAAADTHYLPARSGRHHLHAYLAELARLAPAGREGVAAALRRVGTLLRRRSLVIVASDFYEEEEALQGLRRLSRMGHEVLAVQVLAGDELTLPRGGAVEFEDLETGATLVSNADAIRPEYDRAMQAFVTRTAYAIERDGIEYVRVTTGEALEPALRRFLVRRRSGR